MLIVHNRTAYIFQSCELIKKCLKLREREKAVLVSWEMAQCQAWLCLPFDLWGREVAGDVYLSFQTVLFLCCFFHWFLFASNSLSSHTFLRFSILFSILSLSTFASTAANWDPHDRSAVHAMRRVAGASCRRHGDRCCSSARRSRLASRN